MPLKLSLLRMFTPMIEKIDSSKLNLLSVRAGNKSNNRVPLRIEAGSTPENALYNSGYNLWALTNIVYNWVLVRVTDSYSRLKG